MICIALTAIHGVAAANTDSAVGATQARLVSPSVIAVCLVSGV
jgi:hypothetical protein